jgi:divalent metal cation (Fe/Co/Zn/Cd) transporter
VEPGSADAALGERALAAALRVRGVREIHNVDVLRAGTRTELSLHLKLPGGLPLGEAHDVASRVEAAIRAELAEIDAVHTHLEPLGMETDARAVAADASRSERDAVAAVVREATGRAPRALRLYRTEDGLVVFLTLAVEPDEELTRAHAYASEIERRLRDAQPGIAEVIVHTEP